MHFQSLWSLKSDENEYLKSYISTKQVCTFLWRVALEHCVRQRRKQNAMLTTLLRTSPWLRRAGTSGTAGIRGPSSAILMSDLRAHGTQTTDLLLPWEDAKTISLSAAIRILKCKEFQKVLPVPVVLSWREVKTMSFSSLVHDGLLRCQLIFRSLGNHGQGQLPWGPDALLPCFSQSQQAQSVGTTAHCYLPPTFFLVWQSQ